MKMSEKGLKSLMKLESCKLTAYKCPAGVWTIGLGSTRYADGSVVKEGHQLASYEAAVFLLKKTLERFEDTVNAGLKVQVSQGMFDALVSFTYNVGEQAFRKSTLLKRLNSGEGKKEVSTEFGRWVKTDGSVNQGLVNRRKAEVDLFLS